MTVFNDRSPLALLAGNQRYALTVTCSMPISLSRSETDASRYALRVLLAQSVRRSFDHFH